MTKTDEEILSDASKCPKMYLECIADAIKQARESEREKVAREIFEVWKCPAAIAKGPISRDIECEEAKKLSPWQARMESCERCKAKLTYLGKDGEKK